MPPLINKCAASYVRPKKVKQCGSLSGSVGSVSQVPSVEAATVHGRDGQKIGTIELRSGPSELDGGAFDWGDRSPVHQYPQYWIL
jgi:hypothetical protein